MTLPIAFFARSTLEVARDLVGAVLCAGKGRRIVAGRIVEVEAYLGADDPASHAARGPTPRSAIMFGPPGVAYVYFIYGVHHCLNVVTEPEGRAGAVLIRALEPLAGLEIMSVRRQRDSQFRQRLSDRELCNGPGKLCKALGIDHNWNGLPFAPQRRRQRWLDLEPPTWPPPQVVATPRIGIRNAAAAPYRFLNPGSMFLSRPTGRSARSV